MESLPPKNKFFALCDLQKTEAEGRKEISSSAFSAYLNSHNARIKNVEELLRIPQVGEVFFIQTEKAFNAFTFIPWLAEKYFIEEIFASTYSISRRVVEAIQTMQSSGKIGEITLLISDSMPKRNPKTVDVIEAVANGNANFTIKYHWNHSKVSLIKTKDFWLVLEGSGNWSENAQVEQYIFTNSKEVYEFRKKIFEL